MRKPRRRIPEGTRTAYRPVVEAVQDPPPDYGPSDELVASVMGPAPAAAVKVVDLPTRSDMHQEAPSPAEPEPVVASTPAVEPKPAPDETPAPAAQVVQRQSAQISWSLTPDEKWDIEEVMHEFSRAAGTKIAFAQWQRAFWELMREERERIAKALTARKGQGQLKRPPNQNVDALDDFDEDLKALMRRTLRTFSPKSPPPKEADE